MKQLQIYLPQGQVAIVDLKKKIKQMYLSGDNNPLDVEIGVKGIEEAVKSIRKDDEVREAVMDTLHNYPEKTVELSGAQITKKHTPARYSFAFCGDPEWECLDAQIRSLTEQKKKREEFLKSLTRTEVIVDQQTGEAVEIKPPPKTQGETFAIKFV